MKHNFYPQGVVKDLLQTDLVKPQTIKVLQDRLEKEHTIVPVFFDEKSFEILHAVCKCLIPQHDRLDIVDLPGLLDEQMTSGTGKGWRYNEMPPDKITYTKGLIGINETAELMYYEEFILLEHAKQDNVLNAIQSGVAKGKIWKDMASARFFEELLASLTELYYSHPIAKDEIGEVAFADGKGWQKIGLNEHEVHEPLPLKQAGDDR